MTGQVSSNALDTLSEILGKADKIEANAISEKAREALKEYIQQMDDAVVNAVRFFTWRSNFGGAYFEPGIPRNVQLSNDGHRWLEYEAKGYMLVEQWKHKQFNTRDDDGAGTAFERGDREPLHYRLFCEAKNLRHDNPGASLMIAMVAAEVGVKQLITTEAPDTEWLVTNLPSPDIVRICRDYLPGILLKRAVTVRINEKLLQELKDAQYARNSVAHKGGIDISDQNLRKYLQAVSSLLRVIDVALGHRWAADYIAAEHGGETPTPEFIRFEHDLPGKLS